MQQVGCLLPYFWDLRNEHALRTFQVPGQESLKESVGSSTSRLFWGKKGPVVCSSLFLALPLLALLCVQPKSNHNALPQGIEPTKPPVPPAPSPPTFLMSPWCRACSCQGSEALSGHTYVDFLSIADWVPDSASQVLSCRKWTSCKLLLFHRKVSALLIGLPVSRRHHPFTKSTSSSLESTLPSAGALDNERDTSLTHVPVRRMFFTFLIGIL